MMDKAHAYSPNVWSETASLAAPDGVVTISDAQFRYLLSVILLAHDVGFRIVAFRSLRSMG